MVTLYLLIDLFEELNYFTSRKVGLPVLLLNYLYELPAAVNLLYPVSLLLAVFLVYGQMVRHRELHALQSAGVSTFRMFAPGVVLGLLSVGLYLAGLDSVTVGSSRRLADLQRYRIERRSAPVVGRRQNVYLATGGRLVYARELVNDTMLLDFAVLELDARRHVRRRTDGRSAALRADGWHLTNAFVREFGPDGAERFTGAESLIVDDLGFEPGELAAPAGPIDQIRSSDLRRHIARMKQAGENVTAEEVEYNYRYAYSLIGLVMVLLGLPMVVRLRRGGIMLGLGLGLLLSFLYWGAIQTSRAYGTSHVISPALAAWLPNIVFGAVAAGLMLFVER